MIKTYVMLGNCHHINTHFYLMPFFFLIVTKLKDKNMYHYL